MLYKFNYLPSANEEIESEVEDTDMDEDSELEDNRADDIEVSAKDEESSGEESDSSE